MGDKHKISLTTKYNCSVAVLARREVVPCVKLTQLFILISGNMIFKSVTNYVRVICAAVPGL